MKAIKGVVIGFAIMLLNITTINAKASPQVSYPCSVVLKAARDIPNAQGVAFITTVRKPYTASTNSPIRERISVGVYGDWLPSPASFGDYDQYVGFAQMPGTISWRFKMYPVKEDYPSAFGGTAWVGRFDEISARLTSDTRVEVRLSNSRTNKLGAVILQSTLGTCPAK